MTDAPDPPPSRDEEVCATAAHLLRTLQGLTYTKGFTTREIMALLAIASLAWANSTGITLEDWEALNQIQRDRAAQTLPRETVQ